MLKVGKVEKLIPKTNILEVGFLQLLCLDNFWKGQADREDKEVDTIDEKKLEGFKNGEIFSK